MHFDKIKQDAELLVEAGFMLSNIIEGSAKGHDADFLKARIKNLLDDIELNLKKQEAELNE